MPDKTSFVPELRVLSLWQPWASLMAIGAKKFETRSWQTKYRGWVAIHAAAKWNRDLARACIESPFREVLVVNGFQDNEIPLGKVLAVGRLSECMTTADWTRKFWRAIKPGYTHFNEHAFGDYTPGRFAWHFQDVRQLPLPIPLKASQGLFHAPELLRHQIVQQCPDLNLV